MNERYTALLLTLMLTLLVGCGNNRATPTALPVATHSAAPRPTATRLDEVAPPSVTPLTDPTLSAAAASYNRSCLACHGEAGAGVLGMGRPLSNNEVLQAMSDAEIAVLIREGRDGSHPDNISGVAMPARGGDPSLTDVQIAELVAYIRALQ
ncbi:MAG: cytochrome c [Anaerolineales bacterium]|nr:cytochrome c [Anaerolineales bacterium]MCB9128042.1 cytochrome c [Ardenticatenales bacterium]MCB9172059.1 cytochrome c [Ardenticatenales bacterium]